MPDKVKRALDCVLAGQVVRTAGKMGFARAWVTGKEKANAFRFAKKLKIGDGCNGCGWCQKCCPAGNIRMVEGKPAFGDGCVMCFRCIYGCPAHALQSGNFMVLKGGFSLDALERRMRGVTLEPVEKCCRGRLWKSVREYLLDRGEV